METISQSTASLPDEAASPRRSGCRSGNNNGLMIAAIVLGFVFAWPIGLALLIWAIWHREIRSQARPFFARFREARRTVDTPHFNRFVSRKPSNAALAAYLEREQQRLRDEQEKLNEMVREFEAFKAAEREAIDRQDFEAFLKRQNEVQQLSPDSQGSQSG